MIGRVFSEGLFLGFSTGVICLATCAPVLVPYLMLDSKSKLRKNAPLFFQFLAGRFFAYLAFGLLAGAFGMALKPHVSGKIRAVTVIVTATLMIAFAFQKNYPESFFCRLTFGKRGAAQVPFLFGFLLGFNICPPFLLGMARLLEIGSMALGAVFFSGFFVSSTLYLIPFFLVIPFLPADRLRAIGTIVSFLVGAWYLVTGLISLI